MSIKSDMFDLINESVNKGTSAYESQAKVVRVDGDTLWVHIAGGVDETPVKRTINARVGDTVQVRVSGGRAYVQGNETNPPTDDRTANIANTHAVEASIQAVTASETAEEAKSAVSGAVTQDVLHYLATSQGSGVTTETAGWTTTVQQMTETNRYLWIYHTYVKAGGDTVDTTPVISGVYGQSGSGGGASTRLLSDYSAIDLAGQWGFEKEYFDDWSIGDVVIDADNYGYTIESENSTYWIADTRTKVGSPSVTSVKTQYYLSTSSTRATGGTWSDNITYQTGKYIWTRDVLYFESGGSLNGTAYYNKVLTDACSDAGSALELAEETEKHFWTDSNGVHVTKAEGSVTGKNVLVTDEGLFIRLNTTDLAKFTDSLARVGGSNTAHFDITSNSLSMVDDAQSEIYFVGDDTIEMRELLTRAVVSDDTVTTFTIRVYAGTDPPYSSDVLIYYNNTKLTQDTNYSLRWNGALFADIDTSTLTTFAEGGVVTAWQKQDYDATQVRIGASDSNAYVTITPNGLVVHNDDYSNGRQFFCGKDSVSHIDLGRRSVTDAVGDNSITIGNVNASSGQGAIAIGRRGAVSGAWSIIIGTNNNCNGGASVVTGNGCVVSGDFAIAVGNSLIASSREQVVIGNYNVENASGYPNGYGLILGNGYKPNAIVRRNAMAFDYKNEAYFGLDTSATSGQDYNLKTAINSKGWLSSLISDNMVKIKALLTNIINNLGGGSLPEIDKGRTGSISCNANNYKDATVTFDTAFSAVPKVVVSIYSTSKAGAIGSLTASALDVTTTGFKVRVFNAGSASRSPAVDWIAIN